MQSLTKRTLFAICSAACALTVTVAGQTAHPAAVNPDKLDYKNMPNLPQCLTVGVAHGDPTTGPSTVVLKFAASCDATMHWHTPNEQLVMIKGSGRLQVQGQAPTPATVGAYNFQPSKHPHRFACGPAGECLLYLISDAKFDVHWIDAAGKEITLEEAQKSAGKAPMRQ